MDTSHKQKIKVLASKTDINACVDVVAGLEYFQDNMCEYFKNLNCDGIRLMPIHHVFWAVTKTKLKIIEPLKWLDEFDIHSDICKLSKIRLNLCHEIKKENKLSMTCLQEICLMDSEKRKLSAIDELSEFPKSPNISDNFANLEFDRFDFACDDFDCVKSVTIDSSNVDYFGHTNNVEYVKLILSTFDCEFFKTHFISDFEIHYLKECKEKDNIKIFSKMINNDYYFVIKKEDEILIKCKFGCVKIKDKNK